jgi:RNA polymerase sigma-70 factor, ECF subfamily
MNQPQGAPALARRPGPDQDGAIMPAEARPFTVPSTGDEDASLLQRIREGQEEALQQLHRRYAPLVFHLACRSLDRAAAEEVVQDTFLAVWRRARDFDPARGSLRTWLLSIGHHRMLDELRARSRRPQASGEPLLDHWTLSTDEPLPDETLWREYRREVVSEAVAALPEPQRAALRLAFFADLSHEEVARTLRVPLGTAKTRIRSGLRRLERHLGGLVALMTMTVAGVGTWIYQRHAALDLKSGRALHLLADSHTQVLRLVPAGSGAPGEAGTHATFRGAPGAELAVLTLTRFPSLAPGEHDVLWIQTRQGWSRLDLIAPDREGRALQILDTPWLRKDWPLQLRITRERGKVDQPAGPGIVEWRGAPGPDQPAFP